MNMVETPRSSNIKAVGYDDGKMQVDFKAGGSYVYENVPHDLYESMLEAPSVGKFFHSSVKDVFRYTKVR